MQYCPTELLIADFYTKPLQGAQFRKLRDIILNIKDGVSTNVKKPAVNKKKISDKTSVLSCPQECVEKYVSKKLKENMGLKRTYCDVCKNDKI